MDYPARLESKQAAQILGFQERDIPVLIAHGLLKPLGKPVQNATKYFAKVEILALTEDVNWLNKATMAVYGYWKEKNARKVKNALQIVEPVEEKALTS
jgi:hypothetical protein